MLCYNEQFHRTIGAIAAIFLSAASVCAAQAIDAANAETSDDAALDGDLSYEDVKEIFGELSVPADINKAKAEIGRKLFHDPRLSVNNAVSCASCHVLATGGDDGLALSIGVSGAPTSRNSPSVFNLENHVGYFWDGRAATLDEQIDGPIHHPDEMGETWDTIIKKISADAALSADLNRHFGAISATSIKASIVEFERSLVTNDSPFDRYLAGAEDALEPEAVRGLARFVDYGCASCHQGPTIGGNLYQYFGVYLDTDEKTPREKLKVPSLRNVEHTAPYFNDGREPTLEGAVRTMASAQLGRGLTQEEVDEIVSFLHSLSSDQFSRPKEEL